MTKIESPIHMTVEAANKFFKPDSYVMINCELDRGSVVAGLVIAHAPLEQKGELVDFAWGLPKNDYGKVSIEDTVDLLDGGMMWVELHSIEAEQVPY